MFSPSVLPADATHCDDGRSVTLTRAKAKRCLRSTITQPGANWHLVSRS